MGIKSMYAFKFGAKSGFEGTFLQIQMSSTFLHVYAKIL